MLKLFVQNIQTAAYHKGIHVQKKAVSLLNVGEHLNYINKSFMIYSLP